MAKAQFHKNQRVWVEAVGAWATIERIIPVWSKGFDEPVRIGYDVGMGREFSAGELLAESAGDDSGPNVAWRILRARNKWQAPEDCSHHPEPGTFPVVVTDPTDWGGWRTPGAEYDRDPMKIERQARLIATAPKLLILARDMLEVVLDAPADAPLPMQELAQRAKVLLERIADEPASKTGDQPATAVAPRSLSRAG